jgi:hypothetical protein
VSAASGYMGRLSVMLKSVVVVCALAVLPLFGCASATPSSVPAVAAPAPGPLDGVRRVAIVATGESRFAVLEPATEPGRTFDEVLKWNSYGPLFRPLAALVHQGIQWLIGLDRAADTAPDTKVSPQAVVSAAFARALRARGRFEEVRAVEREPTGADRQRIDVIARVTVPEWGLVRVRAGDPALVSAFAEVRAQMTASGTGVIVWETSQDVTESERVPLTSFKDRRFTQQQMVEVLERAGQRLASELLYAGSIP